MKFFLILVFCFSTARAGMDVPKVQVQGKCDLKVVPDRGRITFTAENQASRQETAVNKTTLQIDRLKTAIKDIGLKDAELKNTGYQVFPVREWEKEKMVHKGYRASLSLEVTTSEISRLGEALIKGSEVGITNVGTLETFLSLEKEQQEYLRCLDIAAKDAEVKARTLAKKLNFKIGDVIFVSEVQRVQEPSPPPPMAMMKATETFSNKTPSIEAGTHKFSTVIDVAFKIK